MAKRQIVDHIRIMNFRFVNTFFLDVFLLFLLYITNGKAFAQDQAREFITGTISDASTGEPLPGVNILVKGTSAGTSSNADGSYELTVPSLQDTLVVSFVGFQTKEVAIAGRTSIDITLQ